MKQTKELLELVERGLAILHHPNVKWTKEETQRSWQEWEHRARTIIARIEKSLKGESDE